MINGPSVVVLTFKMNGSAVRAYYADPFIRRGPVRIIQRQSFRYRTCLTCDATDVSCRSAVVYVITSEITIYRVVRVKITEIIESDVNRTAAVQILN